VEGVAAALELVEVVGPPKRKFGVDFMELRTSETGPWEGLESSLLGVAIKVTLVISWKSSRHRRNIGNTYSAELLSQIRVFDAACC
jgi:hypothetical protein